MMSGHSPGIGEGLCWRLARGEMPRYGCGSSAVTEVACVSVSVIRNLLFWGWLRWSALRLVGVGANGYDRLRCEVETPGALPGESVRKLPVDGSGGDRGVNLRPVRAIGHADIYIGASSGGRAVGVVHVQRQHGREPRAQQGVHAVD